MSVSMGAVRYVRLCEVIGTAMYSDKGRCMECMFFVVVAMLTSLILHNSKLSRNFGLPAAYGPEIRSRHQ